MDGATEQSDPVVEARRRAGRELARWRANANLTQAQLADRVNYSRAHVAGAERGWQRTAVAFWQRCDAALGANGALLAAYARLEAIRQAKREREAHRAEAAREANLERRRTQQGLRGLRRSVTAVPDARFTRPLAAANIGPRRLDPGVINEFEAMTASYRRLYHRTAAEDVLDSLTEHVAGIGRLLRQSRDTSNQQSHCGSGLRPQVARPRCLPGGCATST